MVNTYAAQSGGCRFESLWGFGFSLKSAYYEVGYCGKKNFLSWTAMHIDFVMCKKNQVTFAFQKLGALKTKSLEILFIRGLRNLPNLLNCRRFDFSKLAISNYCHKISNNFFKKLRKFEEHLFLTIFRFRDNFQYRWI